MLLVEQDAEVEAHIAQSRGIPSHGASEGDDVPWSRRVATRAVRWHVLEDGSIVEERARSVCNDVMTDPAQDAVALTLKHIVEEEVAEALPPRRRQPLACVVLRSTLGSLSLLNVRAVNKTGGDAAAVLLIVPEIIRCDGYC